MKKRINLYREGGKKRNFEKNSLNASALVVLLVVAVLLLTGAGLQAYVTSKKESLAEIRTEKNQIEAQVQALQEKFSSQKVNPELKAEQDRIRQQILSRRTLLSLLDQIEPEQRLTFSAYMYALSEASLDGSWLTDFSINMDQRQLSLTGIALSGPEVSLLLEAIGKTQAFSGMSVGSLEVQSFEEGVNFKATAELKVNE